MKLYKVARLGQNNEKGQKLENQEFRRKSFIVSGENGEKL